MSVTTAAAPPGPDGAASTSIVHVGAGTVRLRVRGAAGDGPGRAERPPRPAKYGKWRALTLTSVYLLMGLHIAHWKLKGTTLAPLELNEVMYTLELGIVTAGFLFMVVTFLATAVFGRFFCSWACHIIALQELCAWLLGRLGIRPRPVRSRVLLIVPSAALFYMFIWPQVVRIVEGRPLPALRIFSDEEGWASFLTTDFWRNLPDPWITALTFAVCGFAIVYFLGSRSFCQYACPYGALYGLIDRFAPGRIKLTGHCEQCGQCTAACESHVRVHEEIARYGKVVDPSCMKDLDCVSICPQEAISFGFSTPAPVQSFRSGRRRLRSHFSLVEDGIVAVVFLATLFVFRGLYDAVPFLMTLGLGCILAYVAVLCLRLARRPDVRLNQLQLKRSGRITGTGQAFAALALLLGMFFAHSAFIRYHEFRGDRAYEAVLVARAAGSRPSPQRLSLALGHLGTAGRWGFFHPATLHGKLADLHLMNDAMRPAEHHLRQVLARRPDDVRARLAVAQIQFATGRRAEAADEAQRVVETVPTIVPAGAAGRRALVDVETDARQMLAHWHAGGDRPGPAAAHLERAVELRPGVAAMHVELARLYRQLGRDDDARAQLETAARLDPGLTDPAAPEAGGGAGR